MAQIKLEKRNVITLAFHQEKSDEDYGSCLWADFNFDLDTYTLSISSDCGNYSYGWTPTPRIESFVELMCRINCSDYLLSKISDETEFHFEESVSDTIANLEDYMFLSEDNYREVVQEIKEVEPTSEDYFYSQVNEILNPYVDGFDTIAVVKDYPTQAYKIVEIFKRYVQPRLKILSEMMEG